MRLLLAEDDAILADALVAQFEHAGFAVEHAPNGAVAEYLLAKQDFDAAVLDIGLPMVDGLTVLKHVRVGKPQLPVLVLTALDGLDDRVAGLNAGADDYLTKPFDFPELEARIRALLRRTRPPVAAVPGAVPEVGRLGLDRDAPPRAGRRRAGGPVAARMGHCSTCCWRTATASCTRSRSRRPGTPTAAPTAASRRRASA